MNYDFKTGDRVVYEYPHHLDSKNIFPTAKPGTFIREIESRINRFHLPRRAMVKIDTNKHSSIVYLRHLRPEKVAV